jgi:hypothetical protein
MRTPEELPDYDEASVSQIPALLQLHNLGYTYLTRAEVAKARDSKGQYILREIAFESLRQMLRNQKKGETPKFFLFSQLLLATNVRELKYGTMLTPAKFYTHWKERKVEGVDFDEVVSGVINRNVDAKVVQAIAATVYPDGSVTLKAPDKAKAERIEAFLKRRWRWIRKQQRYFAQFKAESAEAVSCKLTRGVV